MASLSNDSAYLPPWNSSPTSVKQGTSAATLSPPSPTVVATPQQTPVNPAQQVFQRNSAWVKPGEFNYNTQLEPPQELAFRAWLQKNKVPFDLQQNITDYDMRGFYKALSSGDVRAKSAVDPNDGRMHYPDYWKTPYHATFSNESQWADPAKAPQWNEKDQLVLPDGTVVFDDRAQGSK